MSLSGRSFRSVRLFLVGVVLAYDGYMPVQRTNIRPSVNPSDEEVSAWESLNREEQLDSMRAAIEESAASGLSGKNAAEVFQQARDTLSPKDA